MTGLFPGFTQEKTERVNVVFRLLKCLIVYRNALRLFVYRISINDLR